MTGQMIQEEDDLVDEDINFIYVHPSSKDAKAKMKALKVMEKKYKAEIIYNDKINEDFLLMTGETLSDEELTAVEDNREPEMN